MNSKTTEFLAEGIARMIRQHVTERVTPFQSRLDAAISVMNQQAERIAALEAKLAEIEAKSIRRVA